MTSRHSRCTLAVLVFSAAVGLTSAQNARAATDVCATAPVVITLSISGVTCFQDDGLGGGPVTTPIAVDNGKCVTYKAGSSSFDLQFARGNSPFYEFGAPANQQVTVGPAYGTAQTVFNYQSVRIGGQICNNGSTLGLRMR